MVNIQAGNQVRWAQDKRDRPNTPVRNSEIFIVRRVYANGRCDLIDNAGAELFNIPTSHLQLLQQESVLRPKITALTREQRSYH